MLQFTTFIDRLTLLIDHRSVSQSIHLTVNLQFGRLTFCIRPVDASHLRPVVDRIPTHVQLRGARSNANSSGLQYVGVVRPEERNTTAAWVDQPTLHVHPGRSGAAELRRPIERHDCHNGLQQRGPARTCKRSDTHTHASTCIKKFACYHKSAVLITQEETLCSVLRTRAAAF